MPVPAVCFAADVKHSKQMEKAHLIQVLEECRETLNREFSGDLIIPFSVRNGDELVGVSENFSSVYPVVKRLLTLSALRKCPFYLGIGIGGLETAGRSVHTMNGSAVIRAFEARDKHLKEKSEDARIWNGPDSETSVYFSSEHVPEGPLNALFNFITTIRRGWSEKQRQVIETIEKHPEWTYEKIGAHLGYKSPKSTVSHLLKRADYQKLKAVEESFNRLLILYEKELNQKER